MRYHLQLSLGTTIIGKTKIHTVTFFEIIPNTTIVNVLITADSTATLFRINLGQVTELSCKNRNLQNSFTVSSRNSLKEITFPFKGYMAFICLKHFTNRVDPFRILVNFH